MKAFSLIAVLLLSLTVFAVENDETKVPDRDNKTNCGPFGCVDQDDADLVSAKKGKSREPAPPVDNDQDRNNGDQNSGNCDEFTCDNGRGGSFDGGGYEGDGGGFGAEIFFTRGSGNSFDGRPEVVTEDKGDVLVHTITTRRGTPQQWCFATTTVVVEKASGKVLSSETQDFCSAL